ncbi:MAG: AtpZ/AtpI family protein [Rhizobiaceae bacterium]|nr:AtpZ/AtpI family protein [Rhizobiaceae bacterium]
MATNRDDSLEERSRSLGERLKQARPDDEGTVKSDEGRRQGYSQALKISSEFISAIVVGGLLGYLLDYFLPTKPWGLVVLVFLGFCAGVLNVLRTIGKVSSPHPVDRIGMRGNKDRQ